jgi:hypothetical protein
MTIIIVSNALVEEQIGGWNVGEKRYTKVEYVMVKTSILL